MGREIGGSGMGIWTEASVQTFGAGHTLSGGLWEDKFLTNQSDARTQLRNGLNNAGMFRFATRYIILGSASSILK